MECHSPPLPSQGWHLHLCVCPTCITVSTLKPDLQPDAMHSCTFEHMCAIHHELSQKQIIKHVIHQGLLVPDGTRTHQAKCEGQGAYRRDSSSRLRVGGLPSNTYLQKQGTGYRSCHELCSSCKLTQGAMTAYTGRMPLSSILTVRKNMFCI